MTGRSAPTDRTLQELTAFGVLNLDKPPGPTSHQVVTWVKDLLGIDRAAHAGTLDPKVSGCLPILLGDATRLAQALLVGEKSYVAVLELHGPAPADTLDILSEFENEIYQKPPRKSAVSRRLRSRNISELNALEVEDRRILLYVACESGTYIRKLCHDLGMVLGTGGHMGELRRTKTEPFDDRDLVTLHEVSEAVTLADAGDTEVLRTMIQPGERALSHLPKVVIAPSAAATVAHGSPVFAPGVIRYDADVAERALVACVSPDDSAVCLGRLVGDPSSDTGEVVSLERVLVNAEDGNPSA